MVYQGSCASGCASGCEPASRQIVTLAHNRLWLCIYDGCCACSAARLAPSILAARNKCRSWAHTTPRLSQDYHRQATRPPNSNTLCACRNNLLGTAPGPLRHGRSEPFRAPVMMLVAKRTAIPTGCPMRALAASLHRGSVAPHAGVQARPAEGRWPSGAPLGAQAHARRARQAEAIMLITKGPAQGPLCTCACCYALDLGRRFRPNSAISNAQL